MPERDLGAPRTRDVLEQISRPARHSQYARARRRRSKHPCQRLPAAAGHGEHRAYLASCDVARRTADFHAGLGQFLAIGSVPQAQIRGASQPLACAGLAPHSRHVGPDLDAGDARRFRDGSTTSTKRQAKPARSDLAAPSWSARRKCRLSPIKVCSRYGSVIDVRPAAPAGYRDREADPMKTPG
jgi:hypothetical protein